MNVLGENVDKMQLTRRILDLKQVSLVKEQVKEPLMVNITLTLQYRCLTTFLRKNCSVFSYVHGFVYKL